MKICPSCSARLGDDVSICSSCEYRFVAGNGAVDSGAKKTMMGLPALTDYGSLAKGSGLGEDGSSAHKKSPVGSTLFGLPALNFADGLSDVSEVGQDATSMISAKDLKQVLRKEMETAPGEVVSDVGSGKADAVKDAGTTVSKLTEFGMRAPTLAELEQGQYGGAVDEPFVADFGATDVGDSQRQRLSGASAGEMSAALRGWGLDDASSEVEHQATQVLSAEALQRGGFGGIGRDAQAIGFDADDYSEVRTSTADADSESASGAQAGGVPDRFMDVTRSVNPDDLFGADGFLGADGLQKNILDQVRNETLARQTTSLNVPAISSAPASGLVRARTESGQSLRAMMDTPVIYSEESIAKESSVIETDSARETPASGVFKKLKRRLASEAAAENEQDLSGHGFELDESGSADREDSSLASLFDDVSKPAAFAGSTLSSMADELASIPLISDDFGGDLNLPSVDELDFGLPQHPAIAEPELAAEVVRESLSAPEPVAAVAELAAEPVAEVAAVVQAAEIAAQDKPQTVVQVAAAKEVSAQQPAVEKSSSKGVLIAVLIGLLIVGLVLVVLLK